MKGAKRSMKKSRKTTRAEKTVVQAALAIATILDGKKLFKVLSPTGESQNGGTLKWSLPEGEKPGDWHEVKHVSMCYSGLHLTSEPTSWWKPGCRVFEVEAEDFQKSSDKAHWSGDKVVARRVRLVRELSESELVSVGIIRSGTHEIRDGRVIVEGSASVTASGSASVTAYDSASVTASGSASVTASGSASVTAYGSASVTAYGSAKVTAYDSASVTASGSASVTAYGKTLVGTWPTYWGNSATVELKEDASHVDYRGGKPLFRVAE